ncbi:MAG: hypothetical protein KDA41_10000, partial [Planctomycetales bacterium]|nr:hypothetical protein [Planctomycetales bacterium]
LLGGHYDTTTGPKREAASYTAIAAEFNLPPGEIVFVSDIVAELDAAQAAGMQTRLCMRPDNAEVDPAQSHCAIANFTQMEFA